MIDDRAAIDLRGLRSGATTLMSEVSDMQVLPQDWITNPLSQKAGAHRLTGWVTLGGVRALGLGVPEEHDDDAELIFDLWIEQDTGVPAKSCSTGCLLHHIPPGCCISLRPIS